MRLYFNEVQRRGGPDPPGVILIMIMLFMLSHVIPYAKHPLETPPFNRFSASTDFFSDSFA